MPLKPHVQDYEPVTKSGAAGQAAISAFDPPENTEAPLIPQASSIEVKREVTEIDNLAASTTKARSLSKRGHLLTYVGLFIFTGLVYFRPYEIFPSLKWAASSAFIVAIATLAIFVPSQLALEGKITIRHREIDLLLILLGTMLLSMPLALNRAMAWGGFVEYLKVVIIFIILVNVLRTETRMRLLVHLVLVVSCWMSISAANDYRRGYFVLPGARIEGVIGGLFDNPNDMALHLVMMVPITAAFFLTSRHLLGKLVYPLCIAAMVAGIVASFSRGGFLGLICATGFMIWRVARKNRALFLAIAVMFGAVFIALAPGDFRERIGTTGDTSINQRQNDLKRSIYVLIHHPIFGVGINNYVLFSNTDHATHNAYTQVGAELGVPAMVIYLMFLFGALKPLRKIGIETTQSDPKSRYRYLAAGFEASLIGYMVASFFASVAYLWYLYYVVAYSICLTRLYQASQQEALTVRPSQRQSDKASTPVAHKPEPSLSLS
ncbi:MAG TPA: O-antigen ligase family protein [Pyrinomonadaceae bacterium]|nr:O-antigen ligase family protein [Pyrinomonadaceae bacterium]